MDFSSLYALLIYAATAIGVPVPPAPTVYPKVPEQQLCAMANRQPCNPEVRLRPGRVFLYGITTASGHWVAINSNLEIGSMLWKGVIVHEFTHVAQINAGEYANPLCAPVLEYQARMVTAQWFKSQGTSYAEVTGWNLPPFTTTREVLSVCGKPHLVRSEKEN